MGKRKIIVSTENMQKLLTVERLLEELGDNIGPICSKEFELVSDAQENIRRIIQASTVKFY